MAIAKRTAANPTSSFDVQGDSLKLIGSWCWNSLHESIFTLLSTTQAIKKIDATGIDRLDTTGAYFIVRLKKQLGINAIQNLDQHGSLLALVEKTYSPCDIKSQPKTTYEKVYQIGEQTTNYIKESRNLIAFIGEIVLSYLKIVRKPFEAQWKLLLDIIIQTGVKAILITSLLCFLIGIVLCYQIGSQLKIYGANIFVVDLLGISLLREFAPLITAIIVAGRIASSYAAELGSMKVQQEIDALQTFGISPVRRLILPRIIGLIVSLPLLVVIADIISVIGGMIMAKISLGITFYDFINRFSVAVSFNNYLIGLIKSPVFAIIIATVGCYRGTVVENNSLSIGRETTKSVVYAIFLIIVADALFSILFSAIGI